MPYIFNAMGICNTENYTQTCIINCIIIGYWDQNVYCIYMHILCTHAFRQDILQKKKKIPLLKFSQEMHYGSVIWGTSHFPLKLCVG